MAWWHIVVVAEDDRREAVGEPSADLDDVTARAITLADELGRVAPGYPRDCRVELVANDGQIELSIAVLTDGLGSRGGSPGS